LVFDLDLILRVFHGDVGRRNHVKKIIVATLVYLCLTVSVSWGRDAMEFYNRGLKSFLAYKKIEYFTKAIQLNPNLTEAYEKRAIHYYLQWQFDKAIQDYSKVLELKPKAANAYLMKGLAYFKKEYGEGYSTEIKNLAFHLSKQEVPEFSKSLERAIDNFSHAIDLDPQLASAYSYRAKAYRIKGMLEEAVRDSNMVIQLRRDQQSTARAYATLAKIYRKLGQDELSEANYRKSVELDPYSPDYPPLHVPLIYPCVSDTPTLEIISRLGLVGIIILVLVVIFKLTLPAPKK
jgi:tetratricopeptide (TPR) repeat protein